MPRAPRSRSSPLPRYGLLGVALAVLLPAALLLRLPPTADAAVLAPGGAAAYQTKDSLRVSVTLAVPPGGKVSDTLRVELIGPNGRVLAAREKKVEQTAASDAHGVEFPAAHLKPDGHKVRCTFGKERFDFDLTKILVVRAHETSLVAGQEFHAGSTSALRCDVRAVRSATETTPLPGATVDVRLRTKDGKVHELYKGRTGDDGVARADFRVPALPAGDYRLEVVTASALGEEKLERDVKIRADAKILLVTDKPLYQPGQLIHVRALCLHPFDLTPVAGNDIVFEVEDPKGNKVFKRSHKTSDFGVASVDFQLADELNMGAYQVRAQVGKELAHKTVEVKRYVLPKFKVAVTADKTFYLPKETIAVDVRADYFFGKPVAHGKLKVTASTFDVQFRDFQTVETKTDADGHAKVEVKLPDSFVGQPLQKGDALVKLEVKLTDTADHAETVTRTYPVSDQPIRVSLLPEGGRLVAGLENRVFVAALYPDGSPAVGCAVTLRKGTDFAAKPHTVVTTNDAGLAEFRLTPKAEEFRQGEWVQRNVETLGATIVRMEARSLLDVTAEAKDAKGNGARTVAALNGDPFGANVLLRLDKAIYRSGDSLKVDVLTSAGLPTAYLDVVKGGQTLLTRWLDVKDGKASHKLDLPQGLFGTLEVHAYQQLASGEIVRDSRVVYVNSRDDLKVEAKADRDVYLPGQPGTIAFQVTDAAGKPTAAALGVLVVDEAVYALQEMQPGLEKVYFTLQEELLKPQAQLAAPGFRPGTSVDVLVRQGDTPPEKQQIAEALLTAVRPTPPPRWAVDPAQDRRNKIEAQLQQVGGALFQLAAVGNDAIAFDAKARRWGYKPGVADELQRLGWITPETLKDPFGKKLTLDDLARFDANFTPERLGRALTFSRIHNLAAALVQYTNSEPKKWQKDGQWNLPSSILADAAKNLWGNDPRWLKDAWGTPLKLVMRAKKLDHDMGSSHFDYHEIVSAGPDGKFDTADDVTSSVKGQRHLAWGMWLDDAMGARQGLGAWGRNEGFRGFGMGPGGMAWGGGMAFGRGGGGGGGPPGMKLPAGAAGLAPMMADGAPRPESAAKGKDGGGATPTRLREFFPETMLWQPALITDDKGRAELPLAFADSITTWRLSASASSKGGALGGVTAPLRVFQDFFVDIDLPVSLTQNDEVAFPVAVYNYLKTPQSLRLELQDEPWFRLVDGGGLVRALDLKPNEVTSVTFRIKAAKIGLHPLTVKATGSKMSDAVKRSVEVVPDGQKVEQVVGDKLGGKVKQTLTIPENAIPDSSKLIVKLYPGVFSQVLEGVDGMLRMPGG